MASSTNCVIPAEHVGGDKKNTDVIGDDLPLNDLKTLQFFYNVGMNYFRTFASVPPPPITVSPLPQYIQPILPYLHQNNSTPSSIAPASFQTNVRPPTVSLPLSQKITTRVVTDRNSSTLERQQQQKQQHPWSTDSSFNNTTTAISSLSHSRHATNGPPVIPEEAHLNRKVTGQSVRNELDVKRFPGTGTASQIDNGQRSTSGDNSKIEQTRTSLKQLDGNGELSRSQIARAGETLTQHDLTWDKIQVAETEPRSPADSGWMSDVSVSTSNNGGNDEGEGHSLSSCSSLPIDVEDDEETVDNKRVDDRPKSREQSHSKEDGSVTNITGSSKPPDQLADELSKFCLLDGGRSVLASTEGGGQSGGEGDDEESLFSLSETTSEEKKPTKKKDTPSNVRPTTDVNSGTTTRRVMKSIPIRFQRLLEAEVQRVAAMRKRVEGQPLFAAATMNPPSDAQHHAMTGCSNVTNEATQMSVNCGGNVNTHPYYPSMFSAPSVPTQHAEYQLLYNSDQVSYGSVPGTFFIAGVPTSGAQSANESSSISPPQFQRPPAAATVSYQPAEAFYNGSFYQPYYEHYEAYPSGMSPYVVYVDGVIPTTIENQPSFRSATTYDYRMVAPPSTVPVVPSCSTSNPMNSYNSIYVTGATPYVTMTSAVDNTSGNSVYHTIPQLASTAPGNSGAPPTTCNLVPLTPQIKVAAV